MPIIRKVWRYQRGNHK